MVIQLMSQLFKLQQYCIHQTCDLMILKQTLAEEDRNGDPNNDTYTPMNTDNEQCNFTLHEVLNY